MSAIAELLALCQRAEALLASVPDDAGLTREGPSPAGWHELPDLARRVINLAGGPVWPGPWTRWQGPPG